MKRLIPLLLCLILLLTALAPFIQTSAETGNSPAETSTEAVKSDVSSGDEASVQANTEDHDEFPDFSELPDPDKQDNNTCGLDSKECGTLNAVSKESPEEITVVPGEQDNEENGDAPGPDRIEDEDSQDTGGSGSGTEVSWHMTFTVDCVSASCITLTDSTVGMYVSACNDGGGEYRNVEFTPVDQAGQFVSYFVTDGMYPDFGSPDSVAISNPSSSFSYGPLAAGKCITSVFESEITTPPVDYTEYKRFEYRLTADNGETVQSTSAYADKYGCYIPSGSALSVSVSGSDVCVEPDSQTAEYQLRIDNTGNSDLCGLEVSADMPGSFRTGDGGAAVSGSFLYDQPIYTEDYLLLYFDESLHESTVVAGETHSVSFSVNAVPCGSENSSVHAYAAGQIRICEEQEEEPEISLDIVAPSECSVQDPEQKDVFTLTVRNTGGKDFCSVEVRGPEGSRPEEKDGIAVSGSSVLLPSLSGGKSIDLVFMYKPDIPDGETYTAVFTAAGFTDDGETCIEAVSAEASAEVRLCPSEPEPSLDMEIELPSECVDPDLDDPLTFTLTVTNSGQTEFCRTIVSGPSGSILQIDESDSTGNSVVIESLNPGQSVLIDVVYDGVPDSGDFRVEFEAKSFISDGSSCGNEPAARASAVAVVPVCPSVPVIEAEINAADECHVYSGDEIPDSFSYTVENPGDTDYCAVTLIFDVISGGETVHSDTVTIDPDTIPAGGSLAGTYDVLPEEIPEIQPGGSYTVRITASAGVYNTDGICPAEPSVTSSDNAEKQVCPDVRPVLSVVNMNPECIDAGDTLKFRGLIDIDPHSAAERISVNTGIITWGGTDYDCVISSVKESPHAEFISVPENERETTYIFDNLEHGNGAVGFICEAKTSHNEQMRNGRVLAFSASAMVNSVGWVPDYQINSNIVSAVQKCSYAHTTLLPHTGDDTNMPVLIGLFSLFLICGGASSFMLLKKKKANQVSEDLEQ